MTKVRRKIARRFGAACEPRRGQTGVMRLGSVFVVVWLLIGVFAAYQRDYFSGDDASCAKAGTVALTVLAGPLNYVGLNPKVDDCDVPQPSE